MWKVGEVAARTGITVRALHHYDSIGLLSPTARTDAGHRRYAEADLRRLQLIVSLKQLGFPLAEIRRLLSRHGLDPGKVLRHHAERLRDEVRVRTRACRILESIVQRLEQHSPINAESLFEAIRETGMTDPKVTRPDVDVTRYYTDEQMAQLAERRKALGEDAMRKAEADWQAVIASLRALAAQGADPRGDDARKAALKCRDLIGQFTGGDPGIAESLNRMYREEPGMHQAMGIDDQTSAFMAAAMAALDEPRT